jgi:hypothetical protein
MDELPAETSKELTNKLRNWMLSQGYPLEMRVARTAIRAGLTVSQGDYFLDHEQKTHREVDVLACAHGAIKDEESALQIRAVFETKSGANSSKPWIVLSNPNESMHPVARTIQRAVTKYGLEWWEDYACRNKEIQDLAVFDTDDVCGYSLVRANFATKDNRDDQAYAALMQAAKGAAGVLQWLSGAAAPRERSDGVKLPGLIALVLPVIVVDSPLYECWLNDNGELELKEIGIGTILWKNRVSGLSNPTTIIKIMREYAVEPYANSLQTAAKVISKAFDDWREQGNRPRVRISKQRYRHMSWLELAKTSSGTT